MAVDPDSSPLAFFGAELKRLRDIAGMTQGELAEKVHSALATVSAYETAKRIPPTDFAERADEALHADGHLIRLQRLVERTSVLPWFRDRIQVERNASEIREYESYQIPGLLQTEDYARAAISAGRPILADDALERGVAVRMTRQQILELDEDLPIDVSQTPRVWAILDESALHRIVGSAEVMRKQREHLIMLARKPNVTIQVIPYSDGITCAYGKAFTLLTPAGNGSPIVYLEDIRSARYARDRDEVAQYVLTFDHLRACALNDKKSLALIRGDNE
jgi:transcriptional regulator with XRE-family HTH domain